MKADDRFLARQWLNGGSALPLVRQLLDDDCPDEAAATARMALRMPDCHDRDALEATLLESASTPEGWLAALEAFAKAPSETGWEELMRFVPEDVFYQRLRNTVAMLMKLHCDGNILFRCATRLGITSDVFDLARSGTVDPEVIVERGQASPARSMWLALAAQAAFTRGDRWSTIRYLRDACSDEETCFFAWASISEIRFEADEALNEELDKVGVPRV
ncbi:MAG TPA: hypothetical protein VER58_05490 [Thermoanaerobaculia bacterium]|nr:hypothetical protein [Thermoanaerobaculia bacterium]